MSSSTNRQNKKKNEIYPHGFLQNGHRKFLNNYVEPTFKMKAEVLLTDSSSRLSKICNQSWICVCLSEAVVDQ
jgi:hypothetical protein